MPTVFDIALEELFRGRSAPYPLPLRIGAEIEYETARSLSDSAIDSLRLVREYYHYQVEYNAILLDTHLHPKALYKILTKIAQIAILKAKEISQFTPVYLTEKYHYIADTKSIITNSLHIHISIADDEIHQETKEKFFANSYSYKIQLITLNEKLRLNSDPRVVFSHHVAGALRPSEYQFKKKQKFRPVFYAEKTDTFEIRVFSLYDLFFFRDALANTLYRIILAILNPPRAVKAPLARQILREPTDYSQQTKESIYRLTKIISSRYSIHEDDDMFVIRYPAIFYNRGVARKVVKALRIPAN